MGNFNFGSTTTNPLDTGNGYANALLGVFQTYSEADKRVDKDVRHWQNEFYAQDSWKVKPGFTVDYGMRFTHSGPFYDIHHATAAFYPELFDPAKAPRIYAQACTNPAIAGNQTCPTAQRAAIDPLYPTVFVSAAYAGNFVPGTGDPFNGMKVDGLGNGQYWYLPAARGRAARRLCLGHQRRREDRPSLVVRRVLQLPSRPADQFVGNGAGLGDDDDSQRDDRSAGEFSTGSLIATTSPVSSGIATNAGEHYGLPIAYETNVSFQRDIGFSTVVEVAYVGNFIRNDYRTQALEPLPLYVYADPKYQFNGAEISANYLRTKYPGMGTITDTVQ